MVVQEALARPRSRSLVHQGPVQLTQGAEHRLAGFSSVLESGFRDPPGWRQEARVSRVLAEVHEE